MRRALSVLALASVVPALGCSPTYVMRAGYEEAKILWRREPMARVLARTDLDADVRRKLETVLEARTFATGLGLDVDGSFASLSYTDREDNVFVLTAAKKSALEPYTWWFPIVGAVPYKGFFDPALARAEASDMQARGYDTLVRTAAAFSTLGWFADPLLRHLLRHDEEFLVDLVLHEVYHNTFYLRGQAAFNESLATFVGHRGAIEFFRAHPERAHPPGGPDLVTAAEAEWADALIFGRFVSRIATLLRGVYADAADPATALAARDALFARAREEYRALPFVGDGYPSFFEAPLNNAVLLHYLIYATDLDLFEAVYHAHDDNLRTAIAFIQAAAKRAPDDPFAAVRRAFEADGAAPVDRAATSARAPVARAAAVHAATESAAAERAAADAAAAPARVVTR